MKTLLFVSLFTCAFVASAKQIVVALSPFQTSEDAARLVSDTMMLYTQLDLGDTLTLINGGDSREIATLTVPNKKAYLNPKARIKAARPALGKLKTFLSSVSQDQRVQGAMDIPVVLYETARNYSNAKNIVLMGVSPLYDVPTQSGVDMSTGLVPSDAFLFEKPLDNPFGTKGRENLLKNKRIHWRLAKDTPTDSLHRDALTRFWHLYIHHVGGQLVSFTGNESAVTKLLLEDASPLHMAYTLDKNAKLEMRATTQLVPDTSLFQEPVIQKPELQSLLDTKHKLTIGLEWDGGPDEDLDLYVKPHGGEVVYYKEQNSDVARHFKDIKSGRGDDSGMQYETIAFHKAVDLNTLAIAVNVFDASEEKKTINAALRVQIGIKTYVTAFQFFVSHGNSGSDAKPVLNGASETPFTKRFSILDIVTPSNQTKGASL